MTFDTLDYARRLRTAKVPQEQAEAMADALQAAFAAPHGAATKADIAAVKAEIEAVKAELVFHRWALGAILALQLAGFGFMLKLILDVLAVLARLPVTP
jgi:hypothetical protein